MADGGADGPKCQGETVRGALRLLIGRLRVELARQEVTLTNDVMEGANALYQLKQGRHATLVSLITEEIGLKPSSRLLLRWRTTLSLPAISHRKVECIEAIIRLRASRVYALRAAGRLWWIRETGARPRGIRSVEEGLLPQREDWGEFTDPVDVGRCRPWSGGRGTSEKCKTQPAGPLDWTAKKRRPLPGLADSTGDSRIGGIALWTHGRKQSYQSTTLSTFIAGRFIALQTQVQQAVALLEQCSRSGVKCFLKPSGLP